jgi:hypothetical protein
MKKIFTLIVTLVATYSAAWAQLTTFNYTGAMQTYTVPAGVTSLTVSAWGGQGGSGAIGGAGVAGGVGGLGGYSTGTLAVTPGDVLTIFVGGQGGTPTGGFNGGADGGSTNAGGGAGASDIRVGGIAEANRVIVAGGGGGGGRAGCDEGSAATGGIGGLGAFAGSGVGQNGFDSPTSGGVAGGGFGGNFGSVQGLGGAKGVGCGGFSGTDGASATTGTGGIGGSGQTCCCSSSGSIPGGGGGGGGFLGGGGGGGGSAGTTGCSGNSKGAGGGGGGGSCFVGGVSSSTITNGVWSGNGVVTIAIPLSATSTIASGILCNGGSTTVSVVASGGIPPYVGDGTFTVTAGTYNYTITDAAANSFVTTITVTEPTAISISVVSTNVSCNGGSNGAIDITVSGGTPGYTFNWNAGAFTTEDLTGLAAGTYAGVITDANACSANGTVVITEPTVLVSTSVLTNPTTCSGVNGAIDVSVSGGISPYTFLWSNGATTEDLSGLVAGSYTYTVTDASGCTTTAPFTLADPSSPSLSVVSSNVSCNGVSDGAIDITVSGGTPVYTFNWNAGAFTTEDLTGLAPGTYTGEITDANGCSASGTVVITEPAVLVSTSVLTNPTTCSGVNGAIDVTVSGGTAAYTFVWSNAATTEDLSGLVAGSYTYTVTDANGCSSSALSTLADPTSPSVTVALTVDTVCVYNASFALTGGLPAGGTFSGTGVSLGSFNPASATAGTNVITYTFTDVNGCVGTATDAIFVDACTGITTLSNAEFVVYPNPTSGLLNVETTTDDNTITVFDLVGNAVYTVKSTSFKTEIDMQNFANGIYFLKVENSKTVSTIRIVRSK